MASRILIVGGGISGLSLAYRLEQLLPGAEVQVLELDSRPGGTIWTQEKQGFHVELGPNGFLDSKPTTIQLARDLGLEGQLVQASPSAGTNRYLCLDRTLERLPSGLGDLFKTKLLSWRGKLAFIAERFRKGKRADTDESIDVFARRRAGNEVADVFADAMVTGIYAGDPTMLSLPACFPRVAALEKEYGSVLKGFAASAQKRRTEAKARGEPYQRPGKLWSFRGGLRTLVERLAQALKSPPILGVQVRSIHKTGDPQKPTWRVQAEGNDSWEADVCILTCPAHQTAGIVADLDPKFSATLAEIRFNQIAVVALGYQKKDVAANVDGFGFIVPQRLRRDLLGVQWCSSIYAGRAPEGTVLMRALCGGWHRPDLVSWDDDKLLQAVRGELQKIQGISAPPIFHLIQRWQPAIAQYHVGHIERLARLENQRRLYKGLYLGGNSYRGVAMNDCTEQAQLLSEEIKAYLSPN